MNDTPIAIIRVSAPRRYLGIGVLWGLGLLLLWMSATQNYDHPAYQVGMLVCAAGSLWLGALMRRATAREIWLTETELRDDQGTVLATLDDVVAVERGAFAFKPSNGFLLRLEHPLGRVWQPGVWWRMGRRVGVGGVTSAGQTKAVAELINEIILRRSTI